MDTLARLTHVDKTIWPLLPACWRHDIHISATAMLIIRVFVPHEDDSFSCLVHQQCRIDKLSTEGAIEIYCEQAAKSLIAEEAALVKALGEIDGA